MGEPEGGEALEGREGGRRERGAERERGREGGKRGQIICKFGRLK